MRVVREPAAGEVESVVERLSPERAEPSGQLIIDSLSEPLGQEGSPLRGQQKLRDLRKIFALVRGKRKAGFVSPAAGQLAQGADQRLEEPGTEHGRAADFLVSC